MKFLLKGDSLMFFVELFSPQERTFASFPQKTLKQLKGGLLNLNII